MNTHFGERKERKMQDRERRMATEGIGRLMISMAVPSVIAQVINILYSVVDRIYIGHIQGVGMEALTGVGVTFPIITLISAFSAFAGAGGAPLAAIWLGKGDRKRAEKILGNGVTMLIFFEYIHTSGRHVRPHRQRPARPNSGPPKDG